MGDGKCVTPIDIGNSIIRKFFKHIQTCSGVNILPITLYGLRYILYSFTLVDFLHHKRISHARSGLLSSIVHEFKFLVVNEASKKIGALKTLDGRIFNFKGI